MNGSVEKQDFLVAYDYGTGGLWGVMHARSAQQITDRYPELTVVDARPKWMTDEEFERIREMEFHDIDGAPWGMLNAVLADRRSEG
jgi:hypothetical protein